MAQAATAATNENTGVLREVQKAKLDDGASLNEASSNFLAFSGVAKRIDGRDVHPTQPAATTTTTERRDHALAAAEARASQNSTSSVPVHNSIVGSKFSKLGASHKAFTGVANKLN